MPFYLYEIQGHMRIQSCRQSLLSVLKEFVKGEVGSGNWQWHAREEDLLRGMGAEACKKHVVIIDLKPTAIGNVSLYEVEDIWGSSNEEWTPMALRLKPLFVDYEEKSPGRFKRRFKMPSAEAIQ